MSYLINKRAGPTRRGPAADAVRETYFLPSRMETKKKKKKNNSASKSVILSMPLCQSNPRRRIGVSFQKYNLKMHKKIKHKTNSNRGYP